MSEKLKSREEQWRVQTVKNFHSARKLNAQKYPKSFLPIEREKEGFNSDDLLKIILNNDDNNQTKNLQL